MQNEILIEDYKSLLNQKFINWNNLKNKTIFITGATGLIGTNLIKSLLYVNDVSAMGLKIVALVRNIDKANRIFSSEIEEQKPNQAPYERLD